MFMVNRDYTDFMEDLEEDEALRQNGNIYKGVYQPIIWSRVTYDQVAMLW